MRRFLTNNLDWLEEELGNFESDYLIFDLPGLCPLSLLLCLGG